ncbi:MAG: DUF6786 family protein [Bacteroidota bacterium]
MRILFACLVLSLLLACGTEPAPASSASESAPIPAENERIAGDPGTFQHDIDFLRQHQEIFVLKRGDAQIIVNPDWQGRIVTSTAEGPSGQSFGWINYDLIQASQLEERFNPYGGEDRFWLGPEGGQFSFFFPPGSDFTMENWQVPKALDTESFELVEESDTAMYLARNFSLTNYAGTTFEMKVRRSIHLLAASRVGDRFGITPNDKVKFVAFESDNVLTNAGENAWTEETGMPSIWILGMFQPSPQTTVVLPYRSSGGTDPAQLTDTYFGKVPADRIRVGEKAIFFKADGQHRSKIGLPPRTAKPVAGAWDKRNQVLTLVRYTMNPRRSQYVNSLWEQQAEPFAGDVVNAYNDGPLKDGSQMGPFFELESSSPAANMIPGQLTIHTHTTLHLIGDRASLDFYAKEVLGVGLEEIERW